MFLMNNGKIALCAYSYKNMLLDLNYKLSYILPLKIMLLAWIHMSFNLPCQIYDFTILHSSFMVTRTASRRC